MSDFSSLTLNANVTQRASKENDPQNSSNKAKKKNRENSKLQRKQKSSKKEQSSHQIAQQQHKHDVFDESNQNDNELELETKFGLTGSKKIKQERLETEDHNLHGQVENHGQIMEEESKEGNFLSLDGMFEKSKKFQGKSKILYQHHSARQEERNLIHQEVIEAFTRPDQNTNITALPAEDREGTLVTFKYFEFDIRDYIILEILGEGGFGLVIKMIKEDDQRHLSSSYDGWKDIVVKLCRKENEKDFINEVIMMSMAQRAKQPSLQRDDWEDRDYFKNDYFKTDKYYGVFIKQGLGSLLDFRNYLEETGIKLTGQELFFLTWSLLDDYLCLHKVNLCHRDIKLENIMIDRWTSLLYFIDYGLASELSKVRGTGGTPGYKMKDFKTMRIFINQRNKQYQLIADDYFALGRTILLIAFPNVTMGTMSEIKSSLRELKQNKETKILADILEICFFRCLARKKHILEEYRERYFSIDYWQVEDEIQKEDLKYIINNFNPNFLEKYAENFKEKHLDSFQKHMANKWEKSLDNTKKKLRGVTQILASKELQTQIPTNRTRNLVQIPEKGSFYDEEQEIKRDFIKDPEKTMDKCYEILYHIVVENHQTVNPQLYSTLMVVLYHNGLLDEAIDLGEKALEVWGLGKISGIFLNNLSFLKWKRNFQNDPVPFCDVYGYPFLYLFNQEKTLWMEDLVRICRCSYYLEIKKTVWTQERLERNFRWEKKELILADFEMRLEHQESYFLMNYSYIMASQIDKYIDEPTRDKIKEFVYGVNFLKRQDMLRLLTIGEKESLLFTLTNFCKIFQDTTLDKLAASKNDAQEILRLKKSLSKHQLLLHYSTHAMLGFIILYNLQYNLLTKFDPDEWLKSEEVQQLEARFPNEYHEKLNLRYQELRAQQDEKWNRQKFFDSILLFLQEVSEKKIIIPLRFEKEAEIEEIEDISCLKIFNQKIKSLLLPPPAVQGSHILIRNLEYNHTYLAAISIKFRLSKDQSLAITKFFNKFSLIDRKLLQNITLEFSDYDENSSQLLLKRISDQLKFCKLNELRIRMEERIQITDQGILPLFEFISTQTKLTYLLLQFNLCKITSETIESLARSIKDHQYLGTIFLIFQHCQNIEKDSILLFLDEMRNLPKLKLVGLFFGACQGITAFSEPLDLPYKLIPRIKLSEEAPDRYLDFDDYFPLRLRLGDIQG